MKSSLIFFMFFTLCFHQCGWAIVNIDSTSVNQNTSTNASYLTSSFPVDVNEERIYDMKKCKGSGCPYTASWLVHINLYKKTTWYLESTKMETASFNM